MFGWIGWCLVFGGMYFIGNKDVKGFYFCLLGDVFVVTDAWLYNHYSFMVASLIFTGMNIRNIIKWKKDARNN